MNQEKVIEAATTAQVVGDTVRESLNGIIEGLTPVAQKLKIPIEELWNWALKHNYAIAALELLPVIITPLSLFALIKMYKEAGWKEARCSECGKPEGYHSWNCQCKKPNFTGGINLYTVLTVFFGIILVISTIIAFVTVTDGISRLIAPEWHTAKDIILLVNQARGK